MRPGEYKLSPFFKGPSLCRYILGIFWILWALSSLITGLSTRREMYFSTTGYILLTSPTGRYILHHITFTTQLLSRTGNDCSQILLAGNIRGKMILRTTTAQILSLTCTLFFSTTDGISLSTATVLIINEGVSGDWEQQKQLHQDLVWRDGLRISALLNVYTRLYGRKEKWEATERTRDKADISKQKSSGITKVFLTEDMFRTYFGGSTKNLSSFYVVIPGFPSTCYGVQYHLSLQVRSAAAQSFSFSATELRWGVRTLNGATHLQKNC